MVRRTGLRRDELTTLADIGALNAFTNERRSALWQVERVIRPAGEIFESDDENAQSLETRAQSPSLEPKAQSPKPSRGLAIAGDG